MSVQVPKALSRMCMFQWSMFYWPLPRRVWPHCTCGVEMHSSPLTLREARLVVQRHSASMANPSAHLLGPSPAAVNLSWGTHHTAAHSEGTKGPGGASTLLNCSLWYGSPQYCSAKGLLPLLSVRHPQTFTTNQQTPLTQVRCRAAASHGTSSSKQHPATL